MLVHIPPLHGLRGGGAGENVFRGDPPRGKKNGIARNWCCFVIHHKIQMLLGQQPSELENHPNPSRFSVIFEWFPSFTMYSPKKLEMSQSIHLSPAWWWLWCCLPCMENPPCCLGTESDFLPMLIRSSFFWCYTTEVLQKKTIQFPWIIMNLKKHHVFFMLKTPEHIGIHPEAFAASTSKHGGGGFLTTKATRRHWGTGTGILLVYGRQR